LVIVLVNIIHVRKSNFLHRFWKLWLELALVLRQPFYLHADLSAIDLELLLLIDIDI